MDQVRQKLEEVEMRHKKEMAALREEYQGQLIDQALWYEERIKALSTKAGIERERRIQEGVFEKHVLADLCSLVIRDYNPNKYPPTMHTLLTALTVQHKDSNSTDDKTDGIYPSQNPVEAEAIGVHQVSYHQVAAFRDTIIDSLQQIAAAKIPEEDAVPSETVLQGELLHFMNSCDELEDRCKAAEKELAQLRHEASRQEKKTQHQHRLFTLCFASLALDRGLRSYSKEDLLAEFEKEKCYASALKVVRESPTFEIIWSDVQALEYQRKNRIENEGKFREIF